MQLSEETAHAHASKADEALSRGDVLGPLHGVPFTVKDSFDTVGLVSTGGTKGRSGFIPCTDATVVSRLRAAGAVLLGKTNTSELTLSYETDNLIYGRTNNPYDLSRSSGGSSGGPASIVAARGSAFDIGSDYGGSLRYPAHCCGIATIKPTSGRVPRTGHILSFGDVLDSFQQGEAQSGDTMMSFTERDVSDNSFVHTIRTQEGGRVCATAKTIWKKRKNRMNA